MTTSLRIVGDIHGKLHSFYDLLDHPNVVQIGDFGMGFGPILAEAVDQRFDRPFRFIRGNHDDPTECKKSVHWIPDGTVEDGVMYIGGALSIDRAYRTEGVSWWSDEELSVTELDNLIDEYEVIRPRIMITHDCPESIAIHVMIPSVNGFPSFPSRTRDAFEAMLSIHQPEMWIFGHWHHSLDWIDSGTGTRFICLNELEHIDVDT